MRASITLLTAATAVCFAGCGGSSGSSASTTAAVTSAAPAATTSAAPTPTPTVATLVVDPTLVPSGPSDPSWYFRTDDPGTPDNEAARDLARAIAAASNGLTEAFVYAHLTGGGGLGIFVGGLNHERDGVGRPPSGWIVSFAPHVHRALALPTIQVDYLDRSAGTGLPPLDLALYNASFQEGVLRTVGLVEKALSAGARDIRLFGHSKGGDVVQEVTWLRHAEPRLTYAMAVGIPIWSAANPDPDPQGRFGRGGMFRRDAWGTRDYGGKLVVFNRRSDRMSHGELLPPTNLPGPGHDYKNVLQDPSFLDLLGRAVFQAAPGWGDRSLGATYDY